MFKESLRHNVIPYIIDDKRRSGYLNGIRSWAKDTSILSEVVIEAQERFDAQVNFQKLAEHGENFLPEGYGEDEDDE